MSDIRILALDLDGTLTNEKKTVTPMTKRAVHEAIQKGVAIVLASGRPVIGMRHVADALRLSELGGYILAYNGSQIVDCKTGSVVYEKLIPREYYKEICDMARALEVAALTYDERGIITERPDDKYVYVESFNNSIPIKKVDDLGAYVTWITPKFMVVGEPEILATVAPKMQKAFEGRLNVFLSLPYFIEITPMGIEKASALGVLCERLGATRENLMAIGDGLNDIPMLKFAGVSVAMENAFPEVKEVCMYTTKSNDEDGVGEAIKRFIL